MTIATATHSAVARILDALGLKHVRSLRLNMELNSAVAVVTEQYVTGDQLERVALAIETREWVLVPKDENRLLKDAIRRLAEQDATLSVCDGNVIVTMDATLADAEREAISASIVCWSQPIASNEQLLGKHAVALRGLLERLG